MAEGSVGALVCDVSSGLTPEHELKDRLICGSPASHSGRFLRPTERRKPWHDYPLWEHAEQSGVASSSTDPTGLMTGPETGATTTSHVRARSGQHLLKAKKSYNTLLLSCSTESQSFSTKTGIQEETVHSGLRLTDRAFTTSPVETSRSKMFVGRFVSSHPGFPLSA